MREHFIQQSRATRHPLKEESRQNRVSQRILPPPPPKSWTSLFFQSDKFFVHAPPIPRLVDLVHAFNGEVVGHLKKRVEKLLSDSILLWRLLKLLFKILQRAIIGVHSISS